MAMTNVEKLEDILRDLQVLPNKDVVRIDYCIELVRLVERELSDLQVENKEYVDDINTLEFEKKELLNRVPDEIADSWGC